VGEGEGTSLPQAFVTESLPSRYLLVTRRLYYKNHYPDARLSLSLSPPITL
jgi:hypothetical protein